MSEKDKEQSRKKLADIFQSMLCDRAFILAVVLIIPFVFFTAYIIIFDKLETFKDISAVWGAWVGSVIGYFFGSRQVDALIQRIDGIIRLSEERVKELEESKRNYEQAKDALADIVRDNERELDGLRELYLKTKHEHEQVDENMKNDMKIIVETYGQHFDKSLLERLKREYLQ